MSGNVKIDSLRPRMRSDEIANSEKVLDVVLFEIEHDLVWFTTYRSDRIYGMRKSCCR